MEPHRDLILKNAIERGAWSRGAVSGIPGMPDRARLVRDAERRFRFRKGQSGASAFPSPDDVAWSVHAFCQHHGAKGASWTSSTGEEVTLREVSEALLDTLEESTAFLAGARARGDTRLQKRRQGIFAFTCGGAHLFQGAEACAAVGLPGLEAAGRVAVQADLYLWRAALEREAVREALARAPDLAPVLLNQEVKQLGHLLESLGKAERDGLWRPNSDQEAELRGAARALLLAAAELDHRGVYGDPGAVRRTSEQLYLDLVGDACHALRGLQLQRDQGRVVF